VSNFIYGKYPIIELLKHYPKFAKKLWFISDEHFRLLPATIDLPKEKIDAKSLSREFALKAFESHQGLLLELNKDLSSILSLDLENLLIEASNSKRSLIWLPEIQDAHNLGAIVRSSVALGGIGGFIIPSSHSVRLTPTVAKVSAGSVFRSKFAFAHNQKNTALMLQSAGFKLIAVHNSPNAKRLTEFKFGSAEQSVLIFGAEGEGIPKNLLQFVDQQIVIPQTDEIDSFNLSVAAGIVLYEMQRQRIGS
jgi:23S rRNA (guanosine2251-2'-O)-methyltransferase